MNLNMPFDNKSVLAQQAECIDLRRIKSTLVVTHNARSGAHLFSNLMDNHSEILSCPPDSLPWIIEKIDTECFESIINTNKVMPKDLVNWITTNCPLLFKTQNNKRINKSMPARTDLSGFRVTVSMLVGIDTFRLIAENLVATHMKKYNNDIKASDILSLIHWTYALARGRLISTDTPIICWQRHNFIPNKALANIISNTINPIFITTMRQFEDALDSFLSWLRPHYETKIQMFRVCVISFAFNLNKRQTSAPQWAVKFEDMHTKTDSLMKNICEKLNIEFEPTLLETTLDGEPCIWNVRGKLITGTNQELRRRDKFTILNNADIIFINLLFARRYKHFGYEHQDATIEFTKGNPSNLSFNNLIRCLEAVQVSGRSYLANLTFETNPEDLLNLRNILSHSWHPDLHPLDLIT